MTVQPEVLRDKLVEQLRSSQTDVQEYWAYYRNEQRPPAIKTRYSKAYDLLLEMSTSPLARLVVDAIAERLAVEGLRLDAPQADERAWQVWQEARLDERQKAVYREALVAGVGYVSVWPKPNGGVSILPESAAQVAVEYAPGSFNEVQAALKMWVDKPAKMVFCTLYTADRIYKWQAPLTKTGELYSAAHLAKNWERREVPGEEWGAKHPLGNVPIVPFPNRDTVGVGGRSELADIKGIIRRVDKLTLDMLLAAETSAFAQRYIIGAEVPRDEKGNPKPANWAVDKILLLENPQAQVGQLLPAPLDGYLKAIDAEIALLAAVSRVPAHYLYTNSLANPPSADSQRAGEAGLIFKVKERQDVFGESWEQVMRLALPLVDRERSEAELARIETIWRRPDNPSPAQLADFAVKAQQVGVPREALWELLGASPQQIARWRRMAAAEALESIEPFASLMPEGAEPDSAEEEQSQEELVGSTA